MKQHIGWLLMLIVSNLHAQQKLDYQFSNNFKEQYGISADLKSAGALGLFKMDEVSLLGRALRPVYVFKQNSGLDFGNAPAFLNGSYAVEMIFRFDDGCLFLYNNLFNEKAEGKEGQYFHMILSRDTNSKRVLIMLNGKKQMEYTDSKGDLIIGPNREMAFFHRPGSATSGGAVALLRLYNFFVDESKGEEIFKALKPEPVINLKKGEKVVLESLLFVQSKAELLPESLPELERMADYFLKHSEFRFEIQGHTDNQGDFHLNIELSKQRAESIKAYFVSKGIEARKIDSRGFGGTKPIANNANPETRKLNRRVELLVL